MKHEGVLSAGATSSEDAPIGSLLSGSSDVCERTGRVILTLSLLVQTAKPHCLRVPERILVFWKSAKQQRNSFPGKDPEDTQRPGGKELEEGQHDGLAE